MKKMKIVKIKNVVKTNGGSKSLKLNHRWRTKTHSGASRLLRAFIDTFFVIDGFPGKRQRYTDNLFRLALAVCRKAWSTVKVGPARSARQ